MNGFFGIGIGELFFIAIIALVVLGPERLPATMREVAKYVRMARDLSSELTSQFGDELKMLDDINPQKIMQEVLGDPAEEKKTKSTATKKPTTAKKTTATKPAATKTATKAATPAKSDTAEGADSESESAALPVTAATAASRLIPKPDSSAEANPPQDDQSQDDLSKAPDATDSPPSSAAEPKNSNVTNADTDTRPAAGKAADEDVEHRIAPDELTANLEQDDPPSPSESTPLSVNGTHDSVEDRA